MKAVEWMMDQRFKFVYLTSWAQWKNEVFGHLKFVADQNGVKKAELYIVQLLDLNTAYARTKVRVKNATSAISTLNIDNSQRSVCLIMLTDIPVKGALKAHACDNITWIVI